MEQNNAEGENKQMTEAHGALIALEGVKTSIRNVYSGKLREFYLSPEKPACEADFKKAAKASLKEIEKLLDR